MVVVFFRTNTCTHHLPTNIFSQFLSLKQNVNNRLLFRNDPRSLIVRAEKFDTKELVKTVSEKWDDTENKGQVITYVAGATAALWLSSTVVGAINAIPLLPKVMELVGLGYSAWFVYRYVLFKESRKELESNRGRFVDEDF